MPTISDPITIKGLSIRNRLVLPAVTNFFGTADGEVTEASLSYYEQRARHVGLLIVEATAIRADGRIGPFSLGLWNDSQIQGMARLVATIKERGTAALVQINHAGARSVPVEGGIRGASPSAAPFRPDVEPTVLSEAQIKEITNDFVSAAVRAREAGFDGVEVHGAHMYLLSQFLSPVTNQRTDRYGGDAAGRATFAVEVVRAIREALGGDFVIAVRLNAVELMEGGQRADDAAVIARLLQDAGADLIDSSLVATGGWADVGGKQLLQARSALSKEQPRGGALESASQLKNSVSIPVIGVGKLGATEARMAVESGLVDMAAIGRQMIADPETAGKMLEGRDADIVLCRECWGCFASIGKGIPVVCSTNHNLVGTPKYVARH